MKGRPSTRSCRSTWNAAASGSVKTARSSSTWSGTSSRFSTGSVNRSANTPSRSLIPSTLRSRACSRSPLRTRSQTERTQLIVPTTRLPIHCFCDLSVGFGHVLDDADELVPEHAGEAHVALDELEVGGADAHPGGSDERFTRWRRGLGVPRVEHGLCAVELQCEQRGLRNAEGKALTVAALATSEDTPATRFAGSRTKSAPACAGRVGRGELKTAARAPRPAATRRAGRCGSPRVR